MALNTQIFRLKRGDTSPSMLYALLPLTVNLNGATVVFNMMRADGSVKVSRAAAAVHVATGTPTVRYDWNTADTNEDGDFRAEFEVTYGGGQRETFPNGDEFILVNIGGDIA